MVSYLPDFGRPKGRPPPVNLDHLYPDADVPTDVFLIVLEGLVIRDCHVAIQWFVAGPGPWTQGRSVVRQLDVRQEIGFGHLTNWGPLTFVEGARTAASRKIRIGSFTKAQRTALENIARQMPVRVPDGIYNCHDWTWQVLNESANAGIIDRNRLYTLRVELYGA